MKKQLNTTLLLLSIATGIYAGNEHININWTTKGATVQSPRLDSLTIKAKDGHVIIENRYQARDVSFVLSGNSQNGSIYYTGVSNCDFTLKDLTLNSNDSIPLHIKTPTLTTLRLEGSNALTVNADTLDAAMLNCSGNLQIDGKGSLALTSSAVGCKGIKVGKDMTMNGGNIDIATSGMYVEIDTTRQFGPIAFPEGGFPFPQGEGGFQMPEGGFPFPGGQGGFPMPEGGFPFPQGEGGFQMPEGGFPFPQGEGGFQMPEGGFPFPQGEGGFQMPEGGFQMPEGMDFGGFPGKQKYNGSTKGVRVAGSVTINSGSLSIKTSTPGAEGLEGKLGVCINGGNVTIDAKDDGINSGGCIAFRGGKVRVISRGNDAVDSNCQKGEAIVIAGGDVEALSLVGSPEEGLDCDFMPIVVSGGRAIGIGGAMGPNPSVPNEKTATQPTLVVGRKQLKKDEKVSILNEQGKEIFEYTAPADIRDAHMVITCPQLESKKTYTLNIAGKEKKEFTFDKMVVSIQ